MKGGGDVAEAHDEKVEISLPTEFFFFKDQMMEDVLNWVKKSPMLKRAPLVDALVVSGYCSRSLLQTLVIVKSIILNLLKRLNLSSITDAALDLLYPRKKLLRFNLSVQDYQGSKSSKVTGPHQTHILQIIQEMEKEENTPNYIKQLPWYAQDSKGGGELIKIPVYQPKGFLEEWYQRGQKGHQSTHYRKGACENCGAMGHTRKECTERPRKVGARFTNKAIAADDLIKEVGDSWEIKRDRWNGYTPEMYSEVIDEFKQYEQVRKKVKGDEDEARRDDDPLLVAALPTKAYKQKFQGLNTGRNRQDRAKYLNNLDLNSAEFDPKSRTLHGEDEYLKQLSNLEAVGEKATLQQQDNFAYEHVQKHHMELNSTALPTLTEKIFKSVQQKRAGLNSGRMGDIMKRYGVEKQGAIAEVEEDEQEVVDTFLRAKKVIKSKYEQDVLINDHLAVWGSWYNRYLGWGYGCCYSTQKLSYCAGVKGRQRALAKQYKMKVEEAKQLEKLRELEEQAEEEQKEEQFQAQKNQEGEQ